MGTQTALNKSSANRVKRLCAMVYDTFISVALLLLATMLLIPFMHEKPISSGNHFFQGYLLFILFIFYTWCWTRGQTVGLVAWQLKIENERGQKLTWFQASLRFVCAILSVASFGLGLIWLFLDKQALYDRLSKTQVVVNINMANKPC